VISEKLQAAIAHFEAGRYGAAEAIFREALVADAKDPVANHNLGILARKARRSRTALSFFECAAVVAPRNPLYRASLARCLYSIGEWERATSVLEEAASLGLEHSGFAQVRKAMAGNDAAKSRQKIFCVGRNKTGTTSLAAALRALGFSVGLQARGEMLMRDWARRDFARILQLCRTADAFQDVPFSCGDTFRSLDAHFPRSKFILSVRASPQQWYQSLTRFHTKIVGKGRLPTAGDLKRFEFRYPGYLWEAAQAVYGANEESLYDEELYISHYMDHNRTIVEYFKSRPGDLLVLDVAEPGAMEKLCAFLAVEHRGQQMPYLNKSD